MNPDAKVSPAWQPTTVQESLESLPRDTLSVDQVADATTPHVGDRVRCQRATPARGSWSRFAGRVGTVVTVNRRDNEIGVDLGRGPGRLIWFKPAELFVVTEAPKEAPEGRLSTANASDWAPTPQNDVSS